jgi:glycosyltransferase involved in cell wall biosynthesis
MSNTKLLTIVIPTYNRYLELEETLSCLIDQLKRYKLYKDVSFIIADNASDEVVSDSLAEVISSNKCTYYKNTTNIGITRNILEAFKIVTSKYVWFFGDDDFADDALIKRLYEFLNNDIDYIQINRLAFHNRADINVFLSEEIEIKPLIISESTIQEVDQDAGFITSNIISVEVMRIACEILMSKNNTIPTSNNYFIKGLNFLSIQNSQKCIRISSKLIFQKVANGSHFYRTPDLIYKTFFKDQFEVLHFINTIYPQLSDLKSRYQKFNLTNLVIIRLFHSESRKIGREIALQYGSPNLINVFLCYCPRIPLFYLYKLFKLIRGTPNSIQFETFTKNLHI